MTVPTLDRLPRRAAPVRADRLLRSIAILYVVAVLVHGTDHLRRGVDAVTTEVLVAGLVQ